MMREWPRVVLVNLLILVALLAALEVGFLAAYALFDRPPPPLAGFLQAYHRRYGRLAIQWKPECARYDPELAYTLRPGQCQYSGREFSTTVRVNSAGFRDDEGSLEAPSVVVLGDSYAMGWGVEQDETFAARLESLLDVTVLNAGISSYGTVRELAALGRVDRDSLRMLVIQYHSNDVVENLTYAENRDSLPIMSARDYDDVIRSRQRETSGYRFGRFVYEAQKRVTNGLIDVLKGALGGTGAAPDRMADHAKQADAFLHVLATSPVPLDGVRIVLLEVGNSGQNDSLFIDAVRERISAPGLPAHIRDMILVDVSRALAPELYYTWDVHFGAEGHSAVAESIAKAVERDDALD